MFERGKIDWSELGRTLVVIDAANLEKSAQSLKAKVHYSHLRRFFRENEKLDVIHLFDTLILFSGDSDFDYLIQKVKGMGKKVLIFSTRYHVSKELIYNCTRYYDIKKFRQEFLK